MAPMVVTLISLKCKDPVLSWCTFPAIYKSEYSIGLGQLRES